MFCKVFNSPSLKRAKEAIKKRCLHVSRQPRFVRLGMLQAMVPLLLEQPEQREMIMLFLAAYTFLLRLPSEALCMAVERADDKRSSVFKMHSDKVELWLPRRKNKLQPSSQFRPCWCKRCPLTCPVHVLGAYMNRFGHGAQPFRSISPVKANSGLKRLLALVGVDDASEFRTHDLRRGHAEVRLLCHGMCAEWLSHIWKDLRLNGATLAEILRAGDWRSPAFLLYLNQSQLDLDRVAEAHDLMSSDDEHD